jgi:hypothetical protein
MTQADLYQLCIIMPAMESLIASPKTQSTSHVIASLPDRGLVVLRPLSRLIAYLRDAYENDNEELRVWLKGITTYHPENVINLLEMVRLVIPWLRNPQGAGAALFAAQNYTDEDLMMGEPMAKSIYYLGYKQIVKTEPFAGGRREELMDFINGIVTRSPVEAKAAAEKLFIPLSVNLT